MATLGMAAIVFAGVLTGGADGEQAASASHRVASGRIDAGYDHACALLGNGRVRC